MSARGQVTINLGRGVQVVKRSAFDIVESDHAPSLGRKRPIQERLGSNLEGPHSNGGSTSSKRQRRNNHESGSNGPMVSRDDLRYKLMNKSSSSRSKVTDRGRDNIDLREKLSRPTHRPSRCNVHEDIPEPRGPVQMRRIAPVRSADDLLPMETSGRPHSTLMLDAQRHRSRDRLLVGSYRSISPPRSYSELRHVPPYRSGDGSRPSSFPAIGVDLVRAIPYASKPVAAIEAPRTTIQVPPSSDVHRSTYMPHQTVTVSSFLHELGLEKYAIIFQAEEVDMAALKQMGDSDLKDLGIPMGPRKKILLAVQPRQKRHPQGR